jgi:hypothetical protein
MTPLQGSTHDTHETDALLRELFRSEMPDPWPAFRASATIPAEHSRPARSSLPSYVGLAASLLFLIAGLAAGSYLLRVDATVDPERGILPSAARPIQPGKQFRPPPAISPAMPPGRLNPMPMPSEEEPPLSFSFPH